MISMLRNAARIPRRGPTATRIGRVCAVLTLLMLLSQLFGFESFHTILSAISASIDQRYNTVLAGWIVVLELIALPYLIGMPLSTLMRTFAILAGSMVSLFWLITQLTSAHTANSGLFSDTIVLQGGVIAVLYSLVVVILFTVVVVNDIKAFQNLKRTEV
jgi:hypothetical protein